MKLFLFVFLFRINRFQVLKRCLSRLHYIPVHITWNRPSGVSTCNWDLKLTWLELGYRQEASPRVKPLRFEARRNVRVCNVGFPVEYVCLRCEPCPRFTTKLFGSNNKKVPTLPTVALASPQPCVPAINVSWTQQLQYPSASRASFVCTRPHYRQPCLAQLFSGPP